MEKTQIYMACASMCNSDWPQEELTDLIIYIHLAHFWLHTLPLLLLLLFAILFLDWKCIWKATYNLSTLPICGIKIKVTIKQNSQSYQVDKGDTMSIALLQRTKILTYLSYFFYSSCSNEVRKLEGLFLKTPLALKQQHHAWIQKYEQRNMWIWQS